MSAPEVQLPVGTDTLLAAIAQLDRPELEQFIARILALRAERNAPALPAAEAPLLARIAADLTPEDRDRYDSLILKRQAETLSETELTELLALGDRVEALQAQRWEAIVALAELRGVKLPVLLDQLGIVTAANG